MNGCEQQQTVLMGYNFWLIYLLTFDVTTAANPNLLMWYALWIVHWLQMPTTYAPL